MAKPYRRRKGKGGPLVGNYRVTIDGRDLNLGTKDAREATHRARLAADGKWPPEEAAARVALDTIDPGRRPPAPGLVLPPDAPTPPPAPLPAPGAPDAPPILPPSDRPAVDVPGAAPTEPLDAAFAAAAADVGGLGGDTVTDDRASREKQSEAELAALMSELSNGTGQSEIVDSVADGLAAAILWMERKSIEYGWGWTFKRPTGKTLVTHPHNPAGIERKCIKVGMKAVLTIHFPELAAHLTPGWAIAIGCVMGAGVAAATADLVDIDTGERRPAAEMFAAATAPGAPAVNAAPPAVA